MAPGIGGLRQLQGLGFFGCQGSSTSLEGLPCPSLAGLERAWWPAGKGGAVPMWAGSLGSFWNAF